RRRAPPSSIGSRLDLRARRVSSRGRRDPGGTRARRAARRGRARRELAGAGAARAAGSEVEVTTIMRSLILPLALAVASVSSAPARTEPDPLPSWNDGPAKRAIIQLVHATTDSSSPQFVPLASRIATFDQDGTTWVEHPIYTQVVFCLDRV